MLRVFLSLFLGSVCWFVTTIAMAQDAKPANASDYRVNCDPNFAPLSLTRAGNVIETQEAIKDLTSRFPTAPNEDALAALFKYRGVAWLLKREYKNAIEDFSDSLGLNPKQADVYEFRGCAWFAKDQKRVLDKGHMVGMAIELSSVWPLIAQVKIRYKFPSDIPKTVYEYALDDFDRAIRLQPDSSRAYVLRAGTRLNKWALPWESFKEKLASAHAECNRLYLPLKAANSAVKDGTKAVGIQKKELAKAELDLKEAKDDLATATEAFAREKDIWAATSKYLAKGSRDFVQATHARYVRSENDFDAKGKAWRDTRSAQARATRELERLNEVLAALEKDRDGKQAKHDDAKTTRTAARNEFDVAKTDLEDAVADYDEALRLCLTARVGMERAEALRLISEARDILKQYESEWRP